MLLDDLESCAVAPVICGGVPIDDGGVRGAAAPRRRSAMARSGGRRSPPELFAVPAAGPSGPVIGARENSLLTEHLTLTLP